MLIRILNLNYFLSKLLLLALITSTLSTATYATSVEENTINQILQAHNKEVIAQFITSKRNGQITIQKNKSFLTTRGKPNIKFITAKTIIQDLNILEINIANFESELLTHIENTKKIADSKKEHLSTSIPKDSEVPLSKKLKYQLGEVQSEYNKASKNSDRRRLKKELSILRSAYSRAKKNEKSKLRVYFPDKKQNRSTNSRQCDRWSTELQKLTDPAYRHQIFFCNNKNYRDNPKTCDKRYYGQRYTLKEYKKKISGLELNISSKCRF